MSTAPETPGRTLTARRLRAPTTGWCLLAATGASLGYAAGPVIAGRLTERPTGELLGLLAVFLIGAALLDAVGRALWASLVDRAEGQLRADLLDAALHQPLPALSEQAVGEILDRVDDDTHQLGYLVRRLGWDLSRTALGAVPMWVVAGITWAPAWVLFPLVALIAALVVRPLTGEVTRCKIAEEIAWSDHAAVLEEGVAARDDLRANRGQAFVIRRCAELSAEVHFRVVATTRAAARLGRRGGVVLHVLLAAITVTGVLLVDANRLSTASLVTLFLVSTTFVGQIDEVCRQLPDLQAGLGALQRLRSMLEAEPEPTGGRTVPSGPLEVRVRNLHFAYPQGGFALSEVNLDVPAGTTLALVGRTGSGKSTLAALLSRAVDPPPGQVFLGGIDVCELDLQELRGAVGVVTQRTEILAGTVAENITLFADIPREAIVRAIDELELAAWVGGLPDGLDTLLGPDGTSLSAGEEQLLAFARLLVRDVSVVVLDEATARMDRQTETRVVTAAQRLLVGRTGILIAHRLSTTARADAVAVLEGGRLVASGPRALLARQPGPFRDLLQAAGSEAKDAPSARSAALPRQAGPLPPHWDPGPGPGLFRAMRSALTVHPRWGIAGAILFLLSALVGSFGLLTGLAWGQVVARLSTGEPAGPATVVVVVSLVLAPLAVFAAIPIYMRWWAAVQLRVRHAVLHGQTLPHRLVRTPPGEVVARAMDSDRYVRYADRWVDVINGAVLVVLTVVVSQSLVAGGVLLVVAGGAALASLLGAPLAGRSAAAASTTRARFGRSLVSTLEAARTVKLAAATPALHRHLLREDRGRVSAAVREHRVQALLESVPTALVQSGIVFGWWMYWQGTWGLATTLLVTTAVAGFEWFGHVTGAAITEAPGVRAWKDATCRLAAGSDLMALPAGVDLVTGSAPAPDVPPRIPLRRLQIEDLTVIHPDGTIGAHGVNLSIERGQLVMLVGSVGSGKSSLLASLAGLVHHDGRVRWNGVDVDDPQTFLKPSQISYIAQVPRVLSGTFADNVRLDHPRATVDRAIADSRLGTDVAAAGGLEAVVGHRGVRLSGGQVQRLALARALAADAELVLADDASSALDARTELELWQAFRDRGATVLAATSKQAALRQADSVVVLAGGTVAAVGSWTDLVDEWGHLAG